MKTWIIASVVLGLLMIGGIAFVQAFADKPALDSEIQTTNPLTCTECNNGCTAENNCGLSACNAVSGKGSCSCGR